MITFITSCPLAHFIILSGFSGKFCNENRANLVLSACELWNKRSEGCLIMRIG
jgi:hypothetical protein